MDDSFERSESGDGDADWRDAYRTVLDACVPDCVAVEGSAATVPRANALAALADADGRSTDPAETLLAGLAAEGVVDCSGDSVAVLFDPDAAETGDDPSPTTDRWTVAVDALVDELERLVSEVHAWEARETEREIEAELDAIAEEIRDLGSGDGAPDPETLGDDEYERFLELKDEFSYYKKLQEANADPPLALRFSVASLPRQLPGATTDPMAAFERLVEAAAGLQDAIENDDRGAVDDRLHRLAEILDDLAE